MKIGIIGSPCSGKTALLSLIIGIDYGSLSSVRGSGKRRSSIIHVPDQRLRVLSTKIDPDKKIVFATLESKDTISLILDPHSPGHDKNKENLAILRELDGIICVIRAYQDDKGNIAPSASVILKEIDDIKSELLLSDIEIIEKRVKKLEQQVQKPISTQAQDKEELEILSKLHQVISTQGDFASFRQEIVSRKNMHGYGFLCLKPLVIILNIAETDLAKQDKFVEIKRCYSHCVVVSLKLEYELRQLTQQERKEFMRDYGLSQLMTDEIIKTCYQALGLITFFTIGKDEIRAWSIEKGTDAVIAAGKVHTDMARGFISAEVINFQDWFEAGSMKTAKEQGKVKLEGKNHIVKDGDIINFKFNV